MVRFFISHDDVVFVLQQERKRTGRLRHRVTAGDDAAPSEKGAGERHPIHPMEGCTSPVPYSTCKLFYVFHSVC